MPVRVLRAARRSAEARTLCCAPADLIFECGRVAVKLRSSKTEGWLRRIQAAALLKYLHLKAARILIKRTALKGGLCTVIVYLCKGMLRGENVGTPKVELTLQIAAFNICCCNKCLSNRTIFHPYATRLPCHFAPFQYHSHPARDVKSARIISEGMRYHPTNLERNFRLIKVCGLPL